MSAESIDGLTPDEQRILDLEIERDNWHWCYRELEWRIRSAAIKSLASRPDAVKSLMERPDFQAKLQEQLMAQLNGGQSDTPSRSPVE